MYGENAGEYLNKNREWNSKLRFSRLLADKLNLEEINLAANGESNHYTVRTTYDWIEANKDKVKDTLFILGVTEPLRLEFFLSAKKKYQAASMRWIAGAIGDKETTNSIDKMIPKLFGTHINLDKGLDWYVDYLKYFYEYKEEEKVTERIFKFINSHINYRGGKVIVFNSIYDSIQDKSDFNFFNFPCEKNYWKEYNWIMQSSGKNWKTSCTHPSHLSHKWFSDQLYNYALNEKLINT